MRVLWENGSFLIKKELKNKRSNIAYGIRQAWMGKFVSALYKVVFVLSNKCVFSYSVVL